MKYIINVSFKLVPVNFPDTPRLAAKLRPAHHGIL